MLENYVKVALRNITKHKVVSFINIVGLAVGIAGCLIISIWLLNELSYDTFFEDADDIQMVLVQGSFKNNPSTPFPLAEALQREVPEIEHAARYQGTADALVSQGGRAFYEDHIKAVDPAFFDIFSHEFLEGTPDRALDDPDSVVITRAIAEKYFGEEPALGRLLTWNRGQAYTVTGVVAEPMGNSTLRFELLVPFETLVRHLQATGRDPGWGFYSPNTFVRLRGDASREQVEAKISDFLVRHVEDEDALLTLLPFRERRAFFWESGTYILIFSSIALFLLAISCINYVNLTTAQSAERATEISMRKISGAGRGQLIAQLLSESILLTCCALALALALVEVFLPHVAGRLDLDLSLGVVDPFFAVPALVVLVLIVGVAAGAYPAFVLSAFQPAKVISGRLRTGTGHSLLRRTLVIVQLAIAFFLVVGTQVTHKQMRYLTSMDIGYGQDDVVVVPLREMDENVYDTLKAELLRGDKIHGVSASAAGMPYFSWSTGTAGWLGKDPNQEIYVYINIVDHDFTETLQMKLVSGRGFSREFPSDVRGGFIINETLARLMGESTAPGSPFTMEGRAGQVIGIVKDFHFQPATREIGPMALYMLDGAIPMSTMVVRISPGDVAGSLQYLADTWANVLPDYPLEYSFLNDRIESVYWQTSQLSSLATGFSVLAILLAGLGMFGMASFTAGRRARELAIRKVFGGSTWNMGLLLWREYAGCLLLACLVAGPLAYWCMHRWLQGFVFREPIGVVIYFVAVVLVAGITLLAVSWQTLAAAQRNPAVTLR